MTSNLTPHQHITAQLESIALGNEAAFEKAWYEICNLLIGNYAQAVSPKEVHENQIMPRLRALLSLEVAYLDKSHADNASLIAKVEKLSKAVCRRAENEEKALKEADAQSAENAKLRAALKRYKRRTTELPDFKKGDQVILARVQHPEWRGLTGTVERVVNSRKEVWVMVPVHHPKLYYAYPQNLDRA